MKRSLITLEHVADLNNLADATWKAARGKRGRGPVKRWLADLDGNLNRLSGAIRAGEMPRGRYRAFTIHDPKQRTIHAACFEDRVFHHALMNPAAAVFERTLVPSSYACRPGKGVHAAARRVQQQLRRFDWTVQIDIDGYFPSVEHRRLMALLERRFKGEDYLAMLWRVIASHQHSLRRGLPIGSLTSQHFANYYLDGLDRYLLETLGVRAHVRYMDDIVWWVGSREQARQTLAAAQAWALEQRGLRVKASARIQRSAQGIGFCGFRVLPGEMRLSLRRRRRYRQRREHWERAYQAGLIDALALQRGYAAVHSITAQADAAGWRRGHLARCGVVDA